MNTQVSPAAGRKELTKTWRQGTLEAMPLRILRLAGTAWKLYENHIINERDTMGTPDSGGDYYDYERHFFILWHTWIVTGTTQAVPLPDNFQDALTRWYYSGVSEAVVDIAVEITMTTGPRVALDEKFKYLCGVVKRMSLGTTDVTHVDNLEGTR